MIPAALCLLGLAALGAGGWLFWQARRTLRRLDAMLASAIDGGFVEEDYDESALSSLESRMARFILSNSPDNLFSFQLTNCADILNVSYRHLLRMLKTFCQMGVLEKVKNGYRVTSRDSLEKLADGTLTADS